MIIDISCYPTDQVDLAWWHEGEAYTAERLLETMDGPYWVNGKPRRIDKAFIQPPQGNTIYTWTDGDKDGRQEFDDQESPFGSVCEGEQDAAGDRVHAAGDGEEPAVRLGAGELIGLEQYPGR